VLTMLQACFSAAACIREVVQSTCDATSEHPDCLQHLTVAGCTFSLLYSLLSLTAAEWGIPVPEGSAVRTADFVSILGVKGNCNRAVELTFRVDIALALAKRRLDTRQVSAFLDDFNQPSSTLEGVKLAEHAFLCTLLLACPSEPASLVLPLSVLRNLLFSLTTPEATQATCTIIPAACVQLLVAHATARQRATSISREIAEKLCSWRLSPFSENDEPLPPSSVFYVLGAVALYMRASSGDKGTVAGASLRPLMDVLQHHCTPQWAPVLSCFASLECMMPARSIIKHAQRQATAGMIELVQCMRRGCSGDAVRSFAAVAVAAWWLLDSTERPHVSAILLARLCEEDARIRTAIADALQVIHATSYTPLEKILVAQPATLQQISAELIKRPNVRTFPAVFEFKSTPQGCLWTLSAARLTACCCFAAAQMRAHSKPSQQCQCAGAASDRRGAENRPQVAH
jgi:hypothetical protein